MGILPLILWLLGPLLQIGPQPPPGDAVTEIVFALLAVRLIGAPALYWFARGTIGREPWFGLLAVLSPLLAFIAFGVFPRPSNRPAPAAWNPWVMCPYCGTPRGWSPTPCLRCGQMLPVAPYPPYTVGPYGVPLPPPVVMAPPPPPPPAPAAAVPETKRKPPSGRDREVTSGQIIGTLLFALGLSVVVTLAALFPLTMAAGGASGLSGFEASSEFILFSLLVQDSILLAVCFDQSLVQGRLTRREMGLSLKPLTRGLPFQIMIGIAAGVLTFTFSALFIDGLTRLLTPLGVPTNEEPLSGTPVIRGTYDYGLWLISGCIIAPLAEEIFFRGYALSGLKKRGLTNFGLIFTSIVFAAIHMNPVGFVPLVAAGMVMGGLFLKTGSLAAPIVAHATNNFIVTTLVLLGY